MRCIFGFHHKEKYYVHFSKHNEEDLRIKLVQDLLSADLTVWTEKLKMIKTTPINQVTRGYEFENLNFRMSTAELALELNKRFPGTFSALLETGHVVNCVDNEGKPKHDYESFIVDLDNNNFDYYEHGELKKQVPIKKEELGKLCKEWQNALKDQEIDDESD